MKLQARAPLKATESDGRRRKDNKTSERHNKKCLKGNRERKREVMIKVNKSAGKYWHKGGANSTHTQTHTHSAINTHVFLFEGNRKYSIGRGEAKVISEARRGKITHILSVCVCEGERLIIVLCQPPTLFPCLHLPPLCCCGAWIKLTRLATWKCRTFCAFPGEFWVLPAVACHLLCLSPSPCHAH